MPLTSRGAVPQTSGTAQRRVGERRWWRVLLGVAVVVVTGGAAVVANLLPGRRVAPSRRALASSAPASAVAPAPSRAGADGAERARSDSAQTTAATADSTQRARRDSARAASDPRLVRAAALDASGLHILVSLADRRLFVLDDRDTLRVVPVGIGMDSTLVYQGHVWNFHTPRGVRHVLGKEADPVWVPPEWHYVEVARARHLRLARLQADRAVTLGDSTRILVQDGEVGIVRPGEPFTRFASDEEVIWDSTLYIPPLGTKQRQVTGELGRYRLDLGGGYLIHGTPHTESVGQPSSHGCMRLGDDDIAWLYQHVPTGTPVYTY